MCYIDLSRLIFSFFPFLRLSFPLALSSQFSMFLMSSNLLSPLVSLLVKVCVLVRFLVVICGVYGFGRDIHQWGFNQRPLIHPLALFLVLCLSPVTDDFEINLLIVISDGKSCGVIDET